MPYFIAIHNKTCEDKNVIDYTTIRKMVVTEAKLFSCEKTKAKFKV